MRAVLATLALLVAAAVAQTNIPGLPSCAGDCVTSFGNCSTLDVKCICSDTSLLDSLACCVSVQCDAADQETTIQFADSLCAGQGVTDLPSSAVCLPGYSYTGTYSVSSTAAPSGTSSASASTGTDTASSASTTATTSGKTTTAAASTTAATTAAAATTSSSSTSDARVLMVECLGLGLALLGVVVVL